LKQSGDFAVVGTNFQGTKGFRCGDCTRVNVFRDRCGKCGSTNLTPEA
jgi:primosomal protein N'